MRDGKALQMGTSHNLGQNFGKAFDVRFLDRDGEQKFPWSTSWAVSTRLIGALVLVHGDEKGLILPPRIAPTQVVVVPIWRKEEERDLVEAAVTEVESQLSSAGTPCPGRPAGHGDALDSSSIIGSSGRSLAARDRAARCRAGAGHGRST